MAVFFCKNAKNKVLLSVLLVFCSLLFFFGNYVEISNLRLAIRLFERLLVAKYA